MTTNKMRIRKLNSLMEVLTQKLLSTLVIADDRGFNEALAEVLRQHADDLVPLRCNRPIGFIKPTKEGR